MTRRTSALDLHDGTPFWPRRDGIIGVHPPLTADVTTQVVVVGAGITGALIALELTHRGIDVLVVDRRDAGGGSTSASTAMLQYEIDELLIDLTGALGVDDARTAYRECSRGIDLVERATQQIGESCGFRRSPSVFAAIRASDVKTLRAEFDARAACGFDVTWLDADEVRSRWGYVARAAIQSRAGASVDPYALCYHALATVRRRGGRVVDRTDVVEFDVGRRRARLTTARGPVITADHVVVATGYEVEALLPDLAISLNSSFALVTEPIDGLDRRYPDGVLFWDLDDPYLYGRTTDDGRLLIGGKDESYRDPLRRRRALPAKTRALAGIVPKRFPDLGAIEVAFDWCGTFAETPDGLAYIGSHSRYPRCQFALGFGGNGITYSALAAQYISDVLDGTGASDAARLFDLERPERHPS
jgi:glycine/D-amino acid oxidase-like deaminating enzyme